MAAHPGGLQAIDQEAVDPRAIGLRIGDEYVVQGTRRTLIGRILAMISLAGLGFRTSVVAARQPLDRAQQRCVVRGALPVSPQALE